jgi:hypothetical protein
VVHPGGLVNEVGGVRALCLGVDDNVKGTEPCGNQETSRPEAPGRFARASAGRPPSLHRPASADLTGCVLLTGTENRNVPRDDVAEVLLQSLLVPALKNRAVDLVSLQP